MPKQKSVFRYYKNEVEKPIDKFATENPEFKLILKDSLLILKNYPEIPSKKVLITGGIHGNEPAGVLGLIENLNLLKELSLKNNIELTIICCMNPSGYKLNTRENSKGEDLNRNFSFDSLNSEANSLIEFLSEERLSFDLSLDFHETCPEDDCDVTKGEELPTEFYLYEVCANKKIRIGRKIADRIKGFGFPLCKMKKVFGDTCINGVISYPEASGNAVFAQGKSLDLFLYNNKFSKNALTIETIASYEMEARIAQVKEILKICLQ